MLEVHCSGTPREIGRQHGEGAKEKVKGSLIFYEDLFRKNSALDWPAVRKEAEKYIKPLTQNFPQYIEEMQGLAEGAGVGFLDIVALNVRTEINFGLFTAGKATAPTDGCTSLAYKVGDRGTILAQNWDWQKEQAPNLFICHISRPGNPKIAMVTEGGIIGKIGFNSSGVGVCLNAIRAVGVNTNQIPVHLALRSVLESNSRQEAVDRIARGGLAGSAHLLIADRSGATGVEGTCTTIKEIPLDEEGKIVHTNNLLLEHPGAEEPPWLEDSAPRAVHASKLLSAELRRQNDSTDGLWGLFGDEVGYPSSINRCQVDGCETQTLFTIVMDLESNSAEVAFGRPGAYFERVTLAT